MTFEQPISSIGGYKVSNFKHGEFEAERFPTDLRERSSPDFGVNPLNKLGLLYRPVLDENLLIEGANRPNWPDNAKFAVCLTHDLDHIGTTNLRYLMRKHIRLAKYQHRMKDRDSPNSIQAGITQMLRTAIRGTIDSGKTIIRNKSNSPNPFYRLIQLEQSFDVNSTIFVLPEPAGETHYSDPPYRLTDKIQCDLSSRTVASLLDDISSQGFEIGLHASWYSYSNSEYLKQEKRYLEDTLNENIESVRHHWLHFDPRITPSVQHEAGLKFDSTLGFNRNVGFRRGTSYPWTLRDIESGTDTDVLEIPLIVQDNGLLRQSGLGLSNSLTLDYIRLLTRRVKEVGGVLTLLWHPSNLESDEDWDLYTDVLNYLKSQNPYFGTISDIGYWWKNQNYDL